MLPPTLRELRAAGFELRKNCWGGVNFVTVEVRSYIFCFIIFYMHALQ